MTFPVLNRGDVLRHLTNEHGEPLVLLDWWREAFTALDNPGVLEVLLVLTRQAGKSQFIAAEAISKLLTEPGAYVVLVAASQQQQVSVAHRKVRRPLLRLLRKFGLEASARFSQTGVELPELGSQLEVVASVEDTSPGRTVDLLAIDEARYISDDVYAAVSPSVIGASGKLIIASSAGPPKGFFYQLVATPTEHTWVYRSAVNENPRANRTVVEHIRRRMALINPAAVQRELAAEFVDDGEALLPWAVIEGCIDDGLALEAAC